ETRHPNLLELEKKAKTWLTHNWEGRNTGYGIKSKDPKDDLGIFSAAAKQEEWLITIWCRMFHHTLSGAARNWFDDLDPKSMNNFEELSQMFLEEFSQQKGKDQGKKRSKGVPREYRDMHPLLNKGTFAPLTKTPKEILKIESVNFLPPPPLDRERTGLTEESAFSMIPQNSLTDAPIILEGTIEGYHVRRIYVDGGSSSEIMYEHYFKSFDVDVKS
nr:hypothetical protein [Tanacetum cinerariifolium]